jgi:hypothetical protein
MLPALWNRFQPPAAHHFLVPSASSYEPRALELFRTL